ncbi:Copia protein, partial [Mucuna pruriens]
MGIQKSMTKMVRLLGTKQGIDYIETFALVARLEVIHILLSFTTHSNMRLYQINVKSTFLNGIINKEEYVKQPPGFINDHFQNHVFKIKRLFKRKSIYTTLFHKNHISHFIIVKICIDDVIFGAIDESFCKDFSKLM